MFLFSTLIFLALATWLFLNALNEKKWVDSHIHDESVASDSGLFPDLSPIIGKKERDGTSLVEKTGERLQSTATDIKTRTAQFSETLKQRAADENDSLGHIVAKTRHGTSKVVETGSQWRQQTVENSSIFGHKVAETSAPILQKMANKGSEVTKKVKEKLS